MLGTSTLVDFKLPEDEFHGYWNDEGGLSLLTIVIVVSTKICRHEISSQSRAGLGQTTIWPNAYHRGRVRFLLYIAYIIYPH